MVGLDTDFFVALMRGDQAAEAAWQKLKVDEKIPIVPALTLGELSYMALRLGNPKIAKVLTDNISKFCRVINVDRPIVEKAASLKAGRFIPYMDSIIMATFLTAGCRTIHCSGRTHFSEIRNKGISFVFYEKEKSE